MTHLIGNCNFSPDSCQELTTATERLNGLERWQAAQNGHLRRIDERLDKLIWWLLGIFVASAGTLLLGVLQLTGVVPRPSFPSHLAQPPTAAVLNISPPVTTIPPKTPEQGKE